jgi:hypothetical protein
VVEQNFQSFQWTDRDQFVSVDDLDTGASHGIDSPPDARSDDVDGFEEESDKECEW